MKILEFQFNFPWSFFPKCPVDKQYPSIGLDNGLAPNRRQAFIWTNADPVHWPIYAALGGDELLLYLILFLVRELLK